MSVHSFKVVKNILKDMKKEGFDATALKFVENLLTKHIDHKNEAKDATDPSGVSIKDIQKKVSKGKRVLDLTKLNIDRGFLTKAFDEISELSLQYSTEKVEQIKKLNQAVKEGKVDLGKVQNSLLLDDNYLASLGKKLGVEESLVYSIFQSVYQPIFEFFADLQQELFESLTWEHGCCPLCGSLPGMSKFDKENGKRVLWCPICGTEWVYKRMRCPFCENKDQTTLGFFYLDEDSPYRVDFCNKCKTYIKNIDERKVEKEDVETIFLIENLRTLDLDELAKKEGFKARNEVKHKLKRRCK